MTWSEYFSQYVNYPRSQLISIAINEADSIMCIVSAVDGGRRSRDILLKVFSGICLADDNLAREEHQLLNEITETLLEDYYSYDEFYDVVMSNDRRSAREDVESYFEFDGMREAVVRFTTAVAAIDERISVNEQDIIRYFDSI